MVSFAYGPEFITQDSSTIQYYALQILRFVQFEEMLQKASGNVIDVLF